MDYNRFLQEVTGFDFIPNKETADAAIKAVLGILASGLPEDKAQMLTDQLPHPLTLEKLRSHQIRVERISFQEYVSEIANQFGLVEDEARAVIHSILQLTRDTVGEETFSQIEDYLPQDWARIMEKV